MHREICVCVATAAREREMDKIFTFALAVAVSLGTTAVLANRGYAPRAMNAQLAADGAFRDGLYVGRLAAEAGRAMRPPVGRWSSAGDRASFSAGYQRGYQQGVAANVRNRSE